MFGQSTSGATGTFGGNTATASTNRMNDFEVVSPPEDSVSALEFSPATIQQNFLIAGSWDCSVRCWEVEQTGKTVPKSMKTMGGPVLDVSWADDGSKVFIVSEKQVKVWDLASDQQLQVAAHDGPVKTCHWVKGTNYSCLMTGSWDKTLKFWDTRSQNPMMTINLPERCYCADVDYPMAVVGTAGRALIVYSLENSPTEFKRESPLKYQYRTISIFRDKNKKATDDKSRWCEVYFIKNKSEVAEKFIEYKNMAERKTGLKIKCLRSDNGTEYVNNNMKNFLKSHGIRHELTIEYTPQQNGVSERKNRTLLDMARCMLIQSGLPPIYWAEALNTANYVRNHCPSQSLNDEISYKIRMKKISKRKIFSEFWQFGLYARQNTR